MRRRPLLVPCLRISVKRVIHTMTRRAPKAMIFAIGWMAYHVILPPISAQESAVPSLPPWPLAPAPMLVSTALVTIHPAGPARQGEEDAAEQPPWVPQKQMPARRYRAQPGRCRNRPCNDQRILNQVRPAVD